MSLQQILNKSDANIRKWSNLTVNSIRAGSLSIASIEVGSEQNVYLNNSTGDDNFDGLSPSTAVRTWDRLTEVAGDYNAGVLIINLDGTGDFDPSTTIPENPIADAVWSFKSISLNYKACVVRGVVENPVALSASTAASVEPFENFRQWSNLTLGGVDYTNGVAFWSDGADRTGYFAVSSVDTVADPNSVITLCGGTNANTFGATLYTLGGLDITTLQNTAIVSSIPISFDRVKFRLPTNGESTTAKLRNFTPAAIKCEGCNFSISRASYFSGEWSLSGCNAIGQLSPATDKLFTGSELQRFDYSKTTGCPTTIRNPLRFLDSHFIDSKIRVENTFIEAQGMLSENSVDNNLDIDNGILDVDAFVLTNTSNDSSHHCIGADLGRVNCFNLRANKNANLGSALDLSGSNVEFTGVLDLSTQAGNGGRVVFIKNNSSVYAKPGEDSSGITPDFKIRALGTGYGVQAENESSFVIENFTTRNATANPAEVSSAGNVAIFAGDNSFVRLPSTTGGSGDLQLSSAFDAVVLTIMSKIITNNNYTNVGSGANAIKVGGQAATVNYVSGFNAADLATGAANQGCQSFAP